MMIRNNSLSEWKETWATIKGSDKEISYLKDYDCLSYRNKDVSEFFHLSWNFSPLALLSGSVFMLSAATFTPFPSLTWGTYDRKPLDSQTQRQQAQLVRYFLSLLQYELAAKNVFLGLSYKKLRKQWLSRKGPWINLTLSLKVTMRLCLIILCFVPPLGKCTAFETGFIDNSSDWRNLV